MLPTPEDFIARMDDHWTGTLDNTSSDALRAIWGQMCLTFNNQISCGSSASGGDWQVLQPPTGTGKTQGLSVYCSMLPLDDHPGVLIVTRRKQQAEEIAADINAMAGRDDIATTDHSDNRSQADCLPMWPVLVVTHRAYEMALENLDTGNAISNGIERLLSFGFLDRGLVVIDEALDIIDDAMVDLAEIRLLKTCLGTVGAASRTSEWETLCAIERVLEGLEAQSDGPRELMLDDDILAGVEPTDFPELRALLPEAPLDHLLAHRNDASLRTAYRKRFRKTLDAAARIFLDWVMYARSGDRHRLLTSRTILSDQAPGGVVLDATASQNTLYQLFGSRVSIVPVPQNARSYGNVMLHASRGHKVGKVAMLEKPADMAAVLVNELARKLGTDRRILIVCHKDVEPHFEAFKDGRFLALETGHWNALDGRNDWNGFDTVVIFGLPFREPSWAASAFMAAQGPKDTAWLNDPSRRGFGGHTDILESLRTGALAVSVVQAINRVRCRRVIDAQGNCEPTEVFLLLPSGTTGERLLGAVEAAMPAVRVIDWEFRGQRRKVPGSRHLEALLAFMESRLPGRYPAKQIQSALAVPASSWGALVAKLKSATGEVSERLNQAGLRYVVEGAGRGSRSFIVKD